MISQTGYGLLEEMIHPLWGLRSIKELQRMELIANDYAATNNEGLSKLAHEEFYIVWKCVGCTLVECTTACFYKQ